MKAGTPVKPSGITAFRDPAAVNALEQALQVLGGKTAWDGVKAIRVQGQTVDKLAKTRSFTWSDEISARGLKTSGTFQAEKETRHVVTTPDTRRKVKIREKEVELPNMDPLAVIAQHAPAMALASLLRDERYTLTVLPKDPTTLEPTGSSAVWVRVLQGGVQGLPVMDWKLDSTTHLPLQVRRVMPMIPPIRFFIWDKTEFDEFTGTGGARFPASLKISVDSGPKSTLQISSVELNPNFKPDEFVGGEK